MSEYILDGAYAMIFTTPKQRSFLPKRLLNKCYWRVELPAIANAGALVAPTKRAYIVLPIQSTPHLPSDVKRMLRTTAREIAR